MNNIILIGMPGAGKSTIGVILAKVMGMKFIDSDLLIQEQEGMLLKDIISKKGLEGYLAIENQVNRDLQTEQTVIATGGSVVYCEEAMKHLKSIGKVVYIKLDFSTIENRVGNIRQRGVVLKDGQSLRELYDERCPLYSKHAHVVVEGDNLGPEELMEQIAVKLQR